LPTRGNSGNGERRFSPGELIDAVVERSKRAPPPDEYGVFFIDGRDRVVGWARVEHCPSFERAIPMALEALRAVDASYRVQHDKVVAAYKVQHHESGEERIVMRERE
jgi:hypothetical protein